MDITALKVVGIFAVIAGLIPVFHPTLFSNSDIQLDAYSSIELRVKWGIVVGFGLFLATQNHLFPWLVTLSGLLFWLTASVVIARCIGIMLDGLVGKQWVWLLIELIALVVFGFWYYKSKT